MTCGRVVHQLGNGERIQPLGALFVHLLISQVAGLCASHAAADNGAHAQLFLLGRSESGILQCLVGRNQRELGEPVEVILALGGEKTVRIIFITRWGNRLTCYA